MVLSSAIEGNDYLCMIDANIDDARGYKPNHRYLRKTKDPDLHRLFKSIKSIHNLVTVIVVYCERGSRDDFIAVVVRRNGITPRYFYRDDLPLVFADGEAIGQKQLPR